MALFWLVAGSAIQKMTNNQPKNRQAEEENYVQKENIVFLEEKKKGEGKGVKYHGKVKYFLRGEGKGEK